MPNNTFKTAKKPDGSIGYYVNGSELPDKAAYDRIKQKVDQMQPPMQRPMQAPPAPRQKFIPRQYKPYQYAPPGANSWQTDYGAQPEDYTEADYRNPYYTLPKSFTDEHPFILGGYSYLDESNPFMQQQLADAVKAGTYTYYQDYRPRAPQKPTPQPQPQSILRPTPQTQPQPQPQPQTQPQLQSQPQTQPQLQSQPQTQPQLQSQPQTRPQTQPQPQPQLQPQANYGGAQNSGFDNYGFDRNLVDYLNNQKKLSTFDAGISYRYDPATQTFTGGTMGGPIKKTLQEMQAESQKTPLMHFKKGGQVKAAQDTKKKYTSGGKINLNECGVSTAPKGKKNSNW
jgi:hypothetical protein